MGRIDFGGVLLAEVEEAVKRPCQHDHITYGALRRQRRAAPGADHQTAALARECVILARGDLIIVERRLVRSRANRHPDSVLGVQVGERMRTQERDYEGFVFYHLVMFAPSRHDRQGTFSPFHGRGFGTLECRARIQARFRSSAAAAFSRSSV